MEPRLGWTYTKLSPADQIAPGLQTPVLYCFKGSSSLDDAPWLQIALRTSFWKTIEEQFPFALGHLVRDFSAEERGKLFLFHPTAAQAIKAEIVSARSSDQQQTDAKHHHVKIDFDTCPHWVPSDADIAAGNVAHWPLHSSTTREVATLLRKSSLEEGETVVPNDENEKPSGTTSNTSGGTNEVEAEKIFREKYRDLLQTSSSSVPNGFHLSPNIDEKGQDFAHDEEEEKLARLISVRVVLCGGSPDPLTSSSSSATQMKIVIVCHYHHSIFDGASMATFMNTWSDIHRKMAEEPQHQPGKVLEPRVPVVFDPSLVSKRSPEGEEDTSFEPITKNFFPAGSTKAFCKALRENPQDRSAFAVRLRFSKESLTKIQSEANCCCGGEGGEQRRFTKNDALVAYLWRAFRCAKMRALKESCDPLTDEERSVRTRRLAENADVSEATVDESDSHWPCFAWIPVGFRSGGGATGGDTRLHGVSQGFIGNGLLGAVVSVASLHDLLRRPLSAIAARVHHRIRAMCEPRNVQRVLDWEQRRSPPSNSQLTAVNGEKTFGPGFYSGSSGFELFSSWRNFPLYDADFGPSLGGKPLLATVLMGTPLGGVFYFVEPPPTAAKGSIDVVGTMDHILVLDELLGSSSTSTSRGEGAEEGFLGEFLGFVIAPGGKSCSTD